MFGCRSWAESGHAMTVMPDAASRSQWAVVCFFITSYVFFITPTPGPGNTVLTSIKPEIQTTSLGRRDKSTKFRAISPSAASEILSGEIPVFFPSTHCPRAFSCQCVRKSCRSDRIFCHCDRIHGQGTSATPHGGQCPGFCVPLFYHLIIGRLSQLIDALFRRRADVTPRLATSQVCQGIPRQPMPGSIP